MFKAETKLVNVKKTRSCSALSIKSSPSALEGFFCVIVYADRIFP